MFFKNLADNWITFLAGQNVSTEVAALILKVSMKNEESMKSHRKVQHYSEWESTVNLTFLVNW